VHDDVRIAAAEDADEVARVLAAGFGDDPVMAWMFGENRAAKLAAFFGFLAPEALVPLGATFLSDGCCASWAPPDPQPWPDDRQHRFAEAMRPVCTGPDFERMQNLGERVDASHPAQPYWYLGMLATLPEWQGRGRGTQLLAHTLAMVDDPERGGAQAAYLESTNPRNVGLYERHGFRATGRIDLPDGPLMTLMWREPGG
jgi:ribosomal protein S18 acetylase RimI-like enzyme